MKSIEEMRIIPLIFGLVAAAHIFVVIPCLRGHGSRSLDHPPLNGTVAAVFVFVAAHAADILVEIPCLRGHGSRNLGRPRMNSAV